MIVKRLILVTVFLTGCVGEATSTSPRFLPVPTGLAVYDVDLSNSVTVTGISNGISYTEVQNVGGKLRLNANFDTGSLAASLSNPSTDFARSSTQSTAPNYNFIEEATYSGTVSGTGSIAGTSFSANLAGNLTQTSNDRSPFTATAPEAFTGTVTGQVSGRNFAAVTGTIDLGRSLSGQTVPFFSGLGFSAVPN